MVEQAAHNRCVAGSTPALATSGKNLIRRGNDGKE